MKTNTLKKQTKLTTYLALTAGAGLAATAANGATIVTFYGPGATSPTSNPKTPDGINIGIVSGYGYIDKDSNSSSTFRYDSSSGSFFTRGSDNSGTNSGAGVAYRNFNKTFRSKAVEGDANYANVSFDRIDFVYEAVAQFNFGATGGGYLVAIARNDDGSPLSISAGKAAIDAVPEPSSLALLALGSAGLLARRNRKFVA